MRILSGTYKGKPLAAGHTRLIRPLTNRIKESIFNTLGDFFLKKKVLDLFAGSGSFGIEALSRGAGHISFVDLNTDHVNYNLKSLGISDQYVRVYQSDAVRFCLNSGNRYDLIFTDPPFNFESVQNLIDVIMESPILNPAGLLILHHEISSPISHRNRTFQIFKQRRFGRSLISYLISGETDV